MRAKSNSPSPAQRQVQAGAPKSNFLSVISISDQTVHAGIAWSAGLRGNSSGMTVSGWPGLPKAAHASSPRSCLTERSTLLPRVNRAYSGNVLVGCCSSSPGAEHNICISKSEALDLPFDRLPLMTKPRENNALTALKMRPQLLVAQEPSMDAFHR